MGLCTSTLPCISNLHSVMDQILSHNLMPTV